jgi:hypothetical protein
MKKKTIGAITATAVGFLLAAGVSFAQTASPSPTSSPTPTTTSTMPSGAPNTGYGS